MPAGNTVTKTIWQYTDTLPEETMEFLRGIAADYSKVKNFTYKRYSGIKSLNKLTPVYTILNEMRHCGFRERIALPVVYYELAIADAVTDIKSRWWAVKEKVGELITANENLSDDDRIYLRTVLKLNGVYAAVLNRESYEMPENAKELAIDVERLNNLLRRLTRKYLIPLKSENEAYFKISPNGYSYRDGAICIVCRTPRKRISIPLKDNRIFDRQIQFQIRENDAVLAIPVEAKIKKHDDYINTVYVYIGSRDMFTLSNGNIYGESLEELVSPETERLAKKNRERSKIYKIYGQSAEAGERQKAEKIAANNLGRVKYDRQKERERAKTQTFINAELNRMIETEKPNKIVITRPVTKNRTKLYSKQANRKIARSFRGYIRKRLMYKCRIHSIELIEISSSGTGSICSVCGAEGERRGREFVCGNCGLKTTIALNSARNIERKYQKK